MNFRDFTVFGYEKQWIGDGSVGYGDEPSPLLIFRRPLTMSGRIIIFL